ncbi:MAG: enoyl-CoA hydratase-related protein [Anaerolineae bacterium]
MSDPVLVDSQGAIATVTLNRPDKLNAFTDDMLRLLARRLKELGRDADIRCVVVTGAGRAFSAGQDLDSIRERAAGGQMHFRRHLESAYHPVIRGLRGMEKPVLAAVNGVAAGAGASVALAADLIVAGESASFIQAFSKVGLIPDSGSSWALARTIGYRRAFDLASSGRRLSAGEAFDLGLVNRVVADDELAAAAGAWARELAAGPTKALGLLKRLLSRGLTATLDEALAYEAQLQEIAGRTADHAEGVNAFLEKRKANFQGR